MWKTILTRSALALFLVVPFLLREFGITEPYPAILMPSGAGKVNVETSWISTTRLEITAIQSDGAMEQLDGASLIFPIPPQYLYDLAYRRFGMADPDIRNAKLGMWRLQFSFKRAKNDQDIAEVKQWLGRQLLKQGIDDAVAIRVRTVKCDLDVSSGDLRNERSSDEFLLDLD